MKFSHEYLRRLVIDWLRGDERALGYCHKKRTLETHKLFAICDLADTAVACRKRYKACTLQIERRKLAGRPKWI